MLDLQAFRANSFFLVGAPKCGTTSLARHLSDHPEISFSNPKEPHFFSVDYPFGLADQSSLESYLELFPVSSEATRFGEGSVFYLYSAEAIARIEKITAQRAKYVVCLRDPVQASFSLHAQHVAFGWEPERDYLRALKRSNVESLQAQPNPKLAHVLRYLYFYRYADHIERLLERVDPNRVFFVVMERDGADADGLYSRLHGFLGVSARQVDHDIRMNEARRIQSDMLYRILTSDRGLALARAARRILAPKGFGMKRPIRNIAADEAREARGLFQEDIERTSTLVRFNPALWMEVR